MPGADDRRDMRQLRAGGDDDSGDRPRSEALRERWPGRPRHVLLSRPGVQRVAEKRLLECRLWHNRAATGAHRTPGAVRTACWVCEALLAAAILALCWGCSAAMRPTDPTSFGSPQ